ncbi:MAG: autotransporter outer membrane beta-barrel domain-containing protein [Verrucomicrobia bacterium]|nr:MAG: autotransporter outer membrane beta-barrel domain-containing protein [Verrucomicrobiota bacterium]
MKPKHIRAKSKSLPWVICMAFACSSVAHAGLFVDDTAGNAQPTAADNGANTIIANGGTSLAPIVTIAPTVNFTGNAGNSAVLEISSANYTVNNDGVLNGTNHRGIGSAFAFTLNNNGTIRGNGSTEGSRSTGGNTIINNFAGASIIGTDDGVYFNSDGGRVNNSGTIDGITGASSDGIVARDNFIADNLGSGVIQGVDNGLDANDNLRVTNALNALVLGKSGDGIRAEDAASITNFGTVRGKAHGVDVEDDATIVNRTSFSLVSPFGPIAGGLIEGATGIDADDGLDFTNENLGIVRGLSGKGIDANDDATILNIKGATIEGTTFGIDVDDDATVTNHGIVQASGGDAIFAGKNAEISNTGTIRATGPSGNAVQMGSDSILSNTGPGIIRSLAKDAIVVNAAAGETSIVNNSNQISSTVNAFKGAASDDTLFLNQNSQVVGDVLGGGGTDIINFTGGLTSINGSSNFINGNVVNLTEINKAGSGVAFINQPGAAMKDTDVDSITISSGGLYINGSLKGNTIAKTTVNAGGSAIGGTGVWAANVNVNTGGLSAGSAPINLTNSASEAIGKVVINGDVDHAPGSFIRFDVNPNAPISDGVNSDLIEQNGAGNTFDVAGASLRISATSQDSLIRNGTYTVVDSDQVITGFDPSAGVVVQFNQNVNALDTGFQGSEIFNNVGGSNNNTVFGNFFAKAGLADGGTNIKVKVEYNFSDLPGLDSNESSLGQALDDSVTSPEMQDFIASQAYSNLATVQSTLESLDPGSSLDLAATAVSSNYRLHRMVQDHLAGSREGAVITESSAPVMTDAKGAIVSAPSVTSSSSSVGSVWGAVSYDWKDFSSSVSSDLDGEDASFTAGIDYCVAPGFLVGLLADGSRGDYDYEGGGTDVDSLRFAAYATYGEATGFYADALIGYGSHDFSLPSSDFEADSLQAMLTVGYTMQADSLRHGPFAGLEYQNIDIDGYTQEGLIPIDVDGTDIDSLRGLIGYRVDGSYGTFSPYASVAYAHEFEDGSFSGSASLPSGAGFDFNGGNLDSAFLISVGTGIRLMDNLQMNVGYRGEISTGDGVDSHGGSVGFKYAF